MEAIQVHNVTKTYKNGVQALNGLNLSVKKGEIFSLLGQNGAGKSTLIRILTTYLKPSSGNVQVLGKDISNDSSIIRAKIACVAQRTSIDTHLSLEENMMFQADLYKIPRTEAKVKMAKLIEEFELSPYLKYPVSSYSGGIKRRLDIAMNMISNPQILFLDEPTVGMDIQSRMAMWKMVAKIRKEFKTTIFLTTHYLEEADHLSDTICILKDGQVAIQGTPEELKKYLHQDNIKITFPTKENAKEAKNILSKVVCHEKMNVKSNIITIVDKNELKEFEKLILLMLESQIPFTGINISQPALEDIFLRIMEDGIK